MKASLMDCKPDEQHDVPWCRVHDKPWRECETIASLRAELDRMAKEIDFYQKEQGEIIDERNAALERIAALRSALEKIEAKRYGDRQTITPDNAFEEYGKLNRAFVEVCEVARTALGPREKNAACGYCGSYLNDNGVCPSCG